MNLGTIAQNVVALFYDPSAPGLQELILLSINDLTPLITLQPNQSKTLLHDPEIMRHLVGLLSKSEEMQKGQKTPKGQLLMKQLGLSILKALQYLITGESSDYLACLQKEGLLEKFVDHLYRLQSYQTKSKTIVPVEWLEIKCAEIKKRALESDLALSPAGSDSFAQIINRKQLVVSSTDEKTQEKIVKNAPLISAINLHELVEGREYRCHQDLQLFADSPPAKNSVLDKRHGLVFVEGVDLLKLDNRALNILLSAQIVVTTIEVQPKELFSKLYQLVLKDNEKDEKERSLGGLLEAVILFIRKPDYDRVLQPAELAIQPLFKQAGSPLEGLLAELRAWANVDAQLLLFHLADIKNEPFNVQAMKVIKVLKDLSDEKQKNKDKMKKLEVDKKMKDLEALKKKIEETDAKRAKEIEEKIVKLRESGFGGQMADGILSTADKVAVKDVASFSTFTEPKALVNLLHVNDKTDQKIDKIIDDKFVAYREDTLSDDAAKKSVEALKKEFFMFVTKFDDKTLPSEYEQCLSSLSQMHGRRTLVDILSHQELLPVLLKQLLGQPISERKFIGFLKSSFFEAQIMQATSGLKLLMHKIKLIIKNVFGYLLDHKEDATCQAFLDTFFSFDILEHAVKTVPAMFEASPKSVREYFKNEELILTQLNPFFFYTMSKLYLEKRPESFLKDGKRLSHLFNTALYFLLIFQDDDKSGIQERLLALVIRILRFVERNLEGYTRNGAVQELLSNELFARMIKDIDYEESSSNYNNQQKMLLEIQMKLMDIQTEVRDKSLGKVQSSLENSEGILQVRRGKTVLQEKDKFDFLKYLVHYEDLEDHQKETLTHQLETNHYAYDAKVLAHFRMKQAQLLNLTFKEETKLKDFTFVAILPSIHDEKIMEQNCYSQVDITSKEKEIQLCRGDFYIAYPVRRQLVVAFGEGTQDKLGLSSGNHEPKVCQITKNLAPKRIFSSFNHSVLIDKDDRLFRCGTIKKSSGANGEYQHQEVIKEKVKLVALGKFSLVVVTADNKIYRQGNSKEGHLGPNSDYSQLTKFEKVDDEEQITEPIVDVASGTHFTLFVTESGKLYGIGNRFLKEISLDCENKIVPVPLKDGVKAVRAYASMSHAQPLAIVKIKVDGEEQLWSAGRNEQGLLGQGGQVKISKVFKPLKYDFAKIQFKDFSMHTDHAVALDQYGQLFAWGSNMNKRSGFKEEYYDGVFEPRRITTFDGENLLAQKISCGFDHTLIVFADTATKHHKVYTVGQADGSYHHLGITESEAEDTAIYVREVSAFRGFNIVDIAAGHRSSHVIVEGDKGVLGGLHEHLLPDGKQSKGLLHFYFDTEGNLQTLSEEEYSSGKDKLPELCYAIKCPTEKLADPELFPDLKALASKVLDFEAQDHGEVNCEVTHQPIGSGIRYYSLSKINGDQHQVDLSEQAFFEPNNFDINPLIYYRLSRPLKEGKSLPELDLALYYRETADFGLDIEVTPDLMYERNDALVEQTQSAYEEIIESISKFPTELDPELLREMDKYVKNNLSGKELSDIKAKDDFKIADMQFPSQKLKKLADIVKRRRIELYLRFNQIFLDLMPYVSSSKRSGDMTKQFNEVKNMILFSMKNKFIQTSISSLPSGSQSSVEIRRRKAQRFQETGGVDHKGEHTIFGQIWQQIKKNNQFDCLRQNSTDSKSWTTKFLGEGSIDAGGPFREALTNMSSELESDNLPLLIKTANNRNNHGENRDCFVPHPSSKNPSHFEMFRFLGNILGYGIRTLCPIPLHFPPIFWKQVLGDPLTSQDLKGLDTFSWKILEDLKKQAATLSKEQFEAAVQEVYVTRLSDGSEVELKKGGRQIQVTQQNIEEYVRLIEEARFTESATQMQHIIDGINFVIPVQHLKLFTWEEVEARACGDKIVDIEKFKKITNYSCCTEEHESVKRFWTVFEGFNDKERELYLKFVWGRCRLPYDTENIRDRHEIYLEQDKGDQDFPEAHTCFFQLDLPQYSTDEICRQRLLTAITLCGEIDTDGSAAYIDDDNDAE